MELRQEITDLSRLRRWNGIAMAAMEPANGVTTITDMQQAAGRAAPNNLSQEVIQ